MTGRPVVVADDDHFILTLLARVLRPEGYDLIEASDGDEALARIRERSPALVILDAMMPKRDGYSVCRELRADPSVAPQPYVIMLTAGGQDADRSLADEVGVDEFITKPFSPSKLRARVRVILGEA